MQFYWKTSCTGCETTHASHHAKFGRCTCQRYGMGDGHNWTFLQYFTCHQKGNSIMHIQGTFAFVLSLTCIYVLERDRKKARKKEKLKEKEEQIEEGKKLVKKDRYSGGPRISPKGGTHLVGGRQLPTQLRLKKSMSRRKNQEEP